MLHSLAILTFLLYFSEADITTRSYAHYSDSLKIKCDALTYRSNYFDNNCYFAIDSDKLDSTGASQQCSIVMAGSKLAKNVPDKVWRSMFLDKSKFIGESGGTEKAMCKFESQYKCTTGSTTSISGRCIHFGDKTMNYRQAESFCASKGSLPSPENDLENREVAAATTSTVWIRPSHSGKWTGRTKFSRFGACAQSPFYAAQDPKWCPSTVAATVNSPSRGYWTLADQSSLLDVVCIGDADNTEFWTPPPKPKPKPQVPCIDQHKWDETTRRCEWTGPPDACVKLFNLNNQSEFLIVPRYPNDKPAVLIVVSMVKQFEKFHDVTPRAIVRRGCMATFWSHQLNYQDVSEELEVKLMHNAEYGDYAIPNYASGSVDTDSSQGLSSISCYCDRFETEKVNPTKTECVEHHEWSEEQQRCVWTLDEKYAAEIYNYQGMKFLLEIPNWPVSKGADMNFRDTKMPDYEYKVTRIVVRQGCFCTILDGWYIYKSYQTPRPTVGYGDHTVKSIHTKTVAHTNRGAFRVVCDCMNRDSGEERFVRTPKAPGCIELHAYNKETKRCEWTGPPNGCMQITNTKNEKKIVTLDNWPAYVSAKHVLAGAAWSLQLTWLTVRRGCEAQIYVNPQYNKEYMLIDSSNILYGTYRVPQKSFGDVQQGYLTMGARQVNCVCDAALMSLIPANPKTPCLTGHEYDHQTGQCEWTREKRIVAEIRNDVGQTMDIEMPNWPTEKRFTWNMGWSTKRIKNSALFYKKIVGAFVRQHCFITLYSGNANSSKHTLATVGYGNYTVPLGTVRIVVRCLQ